MKNYPKSIRKALREWAAEAYKRELHRELTVLDGSFGEWRAGQIDGWELSDRIHKFHDGPAPEMYNRYDDRFADWNVVYALKAGILTREELPAEVIEAIEHLLQIGQPSEES
jgi:hypothetical protein